MFYTYILKSKKDLSFYIGYTPNPIKRLNEHNSTSTGYTSNKRPWSLVYLEIFQTKSEAIKRERFLKKQKNKAFYSRLIQSENNQLQFFLSDK